MHKTQVNAVLRQRHQLLAGAEFLEKQAQPWVAGLKLRQHGWQAVEQHGPGKADGQASDHAFADILGQAGGLRGLRQQGARRRRKGQSGGSELDRFAVARQQACAHRGFELLNIERQGRL